MMKRMMIIEPSDIIYNGLSKHFSDKFEILINCKHPIINLVLMEMKHFNPDVIILGSDLNNMKGLEILATFKAQSITAPVIFYNTSDDNEKTLIAAAKNGVMAYLTKNDPEENIKNAVSAVLNGHRYYYGNFTKEKLSKIDDIEILDFNVKLDEKLSPIETKILLLYVKEFPNKKIAETLNLSIKTIDNHIKNIKNKLGCSAILDLAYYAIYHKILIWR